MYIRIILFITALSIFSGYATGQIISDNIERMLQSLDICCCQRETDRRVEENGEKGSDRGRTILDEQTVLRGIYGI